MNQYTNGWSPEDVADLIRMNAEGMLPKDIAKALGRSHKSVNAKRWNLGLHAVKQPKAKPPRPAKRAAPTSQPAAPVIEFPIRGLTIAHPEFSGCRWPVGGNGEDTRFCCRPKTRGSYCGRHAKRAYTGKATPASELARALRRYA